MPRGFASPRPSRGGGTLRVGFKIDAQKQTNEFKQARRNINRELKAALIRAAERVVLPEAKIRAGRLKVQGISTASTLIARSTTRSAYLTTRLRGKLGRAVGLQEFGGTVSTEIRPKGKKALASADFGPVASVTAPRTYRGQEFLTGAIHSNRHRIDTVVEEEILHAFRGLEVH